MFTSKDIRRRFVEFFLSKDHAEISQASLIPEKDQTVLFTTAGMQQLVPYLMGKRHPLGKKLCDVQRCVRTVDIDEVGDNRHLTFFEMLGNWSLGSYFKKEAITWSYEFLTEVMKIPQEKIWITVFGGDKDIPLDEESARIWQSAGILKDRIVPIKPKGDPRKPRGDNFWGPAGKSGPCGPCTEMFIDISDEPLKKGQNPDTDEHRFIEVWNDVFMEFHQDEEGKLTKLEQKNVDTGMGLERMVMVMNRKKTVFETDSYDAVIKAIEKISNEKYPPYSGNDDENNPITRSMRVIADHARSSSHIIADGGMPSNEGRGYVLRRLIRRAVRYGRKLGIMKPFLSDIVQEYIAEFREFYPEIEQRKAVIFSTLQIEEEKFFETLERGEKILYEILEKKEKRISGKDVFVLFDTYGFPLDITRDIANENGVEVDENGFEEEMKIQKERSKHKRGTYFDRENIDRSGFDHLQPTKFVGYDANSSRGNILFCQASPGVKPGSPFMIEFALDMTPFYAESGGQIADTGKVETKSGGIVKVWDVQKLPNKVFLHTGEVIQGEVKMGDEVYSEIDVEKREETRRHHSLAHLLHSALRKILGHHVEQQGSLVTESRTRFDFSHPKAVTNKEMREVEELIAEWIARGYEKITEEMELEEAKKKGAVALFSEKYENIVRTVAFGGCSFELCGGTHVRNTGEIGAIKIVKESSIASGIRRMELVASKTAQKLFWEKCDRIEAYAGMLRTPEDSIGERIASEFEEKKKTEKEMKMLRDELTRREVDEYENRVKLSKGKKKLFVEIIPGCDRQKIGVIARELIRRGVHLAVVIDHDGGIAVATPENGISAQDVLKKITESAGGTGGGSPHFVQGAGVDLKKIPMIEKITHELMK